MKTSFDCFRLPIRGATFILCIFAGSPLFATASNHYCGTKQNHIGLNYEKLQSAALDDGAEVNFSQRDLVSSLIVNQEKDRSTAVDFNFQYTIVDFDDSITPMTNGHLHSWDFPVSFNRKGRDHTIAYYLAPVISVSSNGLKNPDLINSESLQLWAGATYKKDMNRESAWLLGIRSDHRFGSYRVYPVAGVCWQPNKDWQLQLALPDISIMRYFSKGINIRLFAEPDGNKWHVFSADTVNSSDFVYNAIVSGVSIEWQVNPTVSFSFDAIQHSSREFSFELDDGTPVETSAQSSNGFTVRLDLLF